MSKKALKAIGEVSAKGEDGYMKMPPRRTTPSLRQRIFNANEAAKLEADKAVSLQKELSDNLLVKIWDRAYKEALLKRNMTVHELSILADGRVAPHELNATTYCHRPDFGADVAEDEKKTIILPINMPVSLFLKVKS